MVSNPTDSASSSSAHPMDFLLAGDLNFGMPNAGEIVTGIVVEHLKNAILVDLGAKSEGIIAGSEYDDLSKEWLKNLSIGDEITVLVLDPDDDNDNILLSFTKAAEEQDWATVQELLKTKGTCEGSIVGYNKGGVVVQIGQLRGFVPVSQLSYDRKIDRGSKTTMLDQLRDSVGDTLRAKVIETDRERNRLILSERAAYKEIQAARRIELMKNLQEGDICEGMVVNLTHFGLFVDLGGVEGLVHLSELSWKRVANPGDLYSVGDKVKVYVLTIDQEKQRIGLSLKRLETDPWTIIDDLYKEGQLVEAVVTKLTAYGAFARLEDDYSLEGLIHISELADQRVNHPADVVKKDQQVTVRVIRIDADSQRLGLSIKQVSSGQFMEADIAAMNQES